MHRNSASTTPAERPRQADEQSKYDVSRRRALISIGKYAGYVGPAMMVLVRGSTALAGHKCGSPNNNNPSHSCIP